MPTYSPTAEQQQIIEAAQTGDSVVIEAGAGTGKTSTLRFVADALAPRKGLYIAYNKAIQLEAAKSFPSNVEARTAHSLAFRQFGATTKSRWDGKFMPAKVAAAYLGIQPFTTQIGDETVTLSPKQIAVVVKTALGRFYNSADTEPNRYHIPGDLGIVASDRDKFVAHVLPYVTKAWNDIKDKNGKLSRPYFTMDTYLKLWSLSNPTLNYDFILFDEAQDANPCIDYIVSIQRAQKILVGDRAQAIYGWRGAIDAMAQFEAEHRLFLTQSFRFGQAVADQANRWLAIVGTPLRLSGFEKIESKLEATDDPNAILCRTNAGVIESAMIMMEAGKRVAITGGTKQIESFAKGASDLMDGIGTDHPDLGVYRTWSEVQQAVKDGEASDLGAMVRIIDNYGISAVLNVCRNSSKPQDADVQVSTAHKAKGLEWDQVRIHTDFQPPKEGNAISITEAMLIYVAVTRAKLVLDDGALGWLDQFEVALAEAV